MYYRYRQLGLDLHSQDGFLFSHLEALRTASRNHAIPRALKDQLDASLSRCRDSQEEAIEELSRYDVDRASSKWRFGLWGGSSLKSKYKRFKSDLDELDTLCLRMSFVNYASSNLLRPEHFKLIHETAEQQPGRLLSLSDIWVARGNYEGSEERHDGDFVLEKKYIENDVQALCNILRKASPVEGILPCLGYRQPLYNESTPPYRSFLQLVMELPAGENRQSLAHKLDIEGTPSLSSRIELAKALAIAVSKVHDLGLVHKSIRSRAILLTSEQNKSSLPKLFLQDWTYVRRQAGATSQNGGEDVWQRLVYEHPERQRSLDHFPETAYEPKHDIYSLGVVLMEIVLWMPFVERCDRNNLESDLRIAKIYEGTALSLGGDVMPQHYAGDSRKLTRFPNVIKDVWLQIAKKDVNIVDRELSQIAVGCLDAQYVSAQEVLEALKRIKIL